MAIVLPTRRLHDRIGLLVTAVMALALLLSGLWWALTAREAIHEEVEAAARVAEQWMGVLVREAEAAGSTGQLAAQLAAVGRVRSNVLEIHDSEGRLRYRSPGSPYKAGREAPAWFAALMSPDFAPRLMDAGELRLSLHPDASRATLDAWDKLLQIGGWALALLVLLGLAVRHAIDRALAPLAALETALERSADGRFDLRLPDHGVAELDRLARCYNRMADELDSSLRHNARLEEDQAFAQALHARLEDERRQIARELHDELGQAVTAVRAMAGAIAQRSAGEAGVHGSALAILAMTSQMQDGVRTILQRLRRPAPLPEGRLGEAMAQYCEHWSALYPAIALQRRIDEVPLALDEEFCLNVLRLLQESLTNVARHAGAAHVSVELGCRDGELRLTVADDGGGFDSARPSERFGLAGMRERVAACRGTLEFPPRDEGGTCVSVRLPLPPADRVAERAPVGAPPSPGAPR